MIEDPATSEPQKINLQAAIDMYHREELPGPIRLIQDGKVVSIKDVEASRAWWAEGLASQLSSQITTPATAPETSSSPSRSVPWGASDLSGL